MVEIDRERLLQDLHALREFGRAGPGVVRPTYSDQDIRARNWLSQRMEAAGLQASLDGVGNVIGRSPNAGPALVIGSHSDTQPRGGWLDGAMGVIYGLEIARALLADPSTSHLAVDAVAWADEEGTYSSCLGARSFVGELTEADMSECNADGETVSAAIERAGLGGRSTASFEPDRHRAYLEAHIEQGPYLEEYRNRIGVVTSIVGIRGIRFEFSGQQNHAGTTPMKRRQDAAVAMFEFGHRLQSVMAEVASPTSVWTTGVVDVEPGAESIIPGAAGLTLQFRDADDDILDAMQNAALTLAAEMDSRGPVRVAGAPLREKITPTLMAPELRQHIGAAAEALVPGGWVEMPSAAGHDSMVLSHHLPCAMLFIPSINGISHDFAEDSDEDDIALGCQVLANAAVSILTELQ